jgi:hypothetical protein
MDIPLGLAFGLPAAQAAYLAFAAYAVAWSERRGTKPGWYFALLNNCMGAFPVGFALAILFFHITGAIPGGLTWPEGVLVPLELLLGLVALVIAAKAGSSEWLAVVPFGIIGALAIIIGLTQSGDPISYLSGHTEHRCATPECLVLSAHANLFAGVMLLIGLMQAIPRPRMYPGVGEVLFTMLAGLLLALGMVTLPWFLPIAWYWKIAAFFGILWLTGIAGTLPRAVSTMSSRETVVPGVEPVLHRDEAAHVQALVDTASRVGEGGTGAAEVAFRWPLREYRYTRRAASANSACEWCESELVAFVWQEAEVGGPVYLCALCDAAGKDLADDSEAEWWVRSRMSS